MLSTSCCPVFITSLEYLGLPVLGFMCFHHKRHFPVLHSGLRPKKVPPHPRFNLHFSYIFFMKRLSEKDDWRVPHAWGSPNEAGSHVSRPLLFSIILSLSAYLQRLRVVGLCWAGSYRKILPRCFVRTQYICQRTLELTCMRPKARQSCLTPRPYGL